jgi:hypothetical protein
MTARFRATIARSTFPACCFLAAPAVAEIVRPVAPPPPAVCTRRGRDHDSRPVSSAPNRRSQPIPGLRSPSGLLAPFRIKAFPGSLPESLPSESARLLFAPRNRFYKIAAAADHRSELATFPEARSSDSRFPSRVLGPTRAASAVSPRRPHPLLQFTRSPESCQCPRYRPMGWRLLPDLRPSRGRPSRSFRGPRSRNDDESMRDPLVSFALLQSLTRAGPSAVSCRTRRWIGTDTLSWGSSPLQRIR